MFLQNVPDMNGTFHQQSYLKLIISIFKTSLWNKDLLYINVKRKKVNTYNVLPNQL